MNAQPYILDSPPVAILFFLILLLFALTYVHGLGATLALVLDLVRRALLRLRSRIARINWQPLASDARDVRAILRTR